MSVTFRFQQLLGDFKEGNFPELPKEEKDKLIEKSIEAIKKVKQENPKSKKILVTSDSVTLLNRASELDFVYVIPGELVHMGYSNDGKDEQKHLKSFLDFFMIARADRVYFAKAPMIYGSTFALTASKVYNKPYIEIDLDK